MRSTSTNLRRLRNKEAQQEHTGLVATAVYPYYARVANSIAGNNVSSYAARERSASTCLYRLGCAFFQRFWGHRRVLVYLSELNTKILSFLNWTTFTFDIRCISLVNLLTSVMLLQCQHAVAGASA